jgi:hypothetical protein
LDLEQCADHFRNSRLGSSGMFSKEDWDIVLQISAFFADPSFGSVVEDEFARLLLSSVSVIKELPLISPTISTLGVHAELFFFNIAGERT